MKRAAVIAALVTFATFARTPSSATNMIHGPPDDAWAHGKFTADNDCASCHSDIATQWAGSAHAHSHDDPIYRAQFAKDPSPFCTSCHAPQNAAIGCDTCHVRDGKVYGAKSNDAHDVQASLSFKTGAVCASCHQFAFPDVKGHPDADAWMQSTWSEWLGSRTGTCTSCHRTHDLHADRRPVDVRVTTEREGKTAILLFTLKSRTGHAFPTGDIFREARIVCESGGTTVESSPLRRTYRLLPSGARRVANDLRLPANGTLHLEVRIDAPPGAAIRYRLEHLRMSDALAQELNLTEHNRQTFLTGSVAAP